MTSGGVTDIVSLYVYQAKELIPAIWLDAEDETLGDFSIYNPAIVRFRGRLLMAYRMDSGRRETMRRRIGLCELNANLNVIPDSVVSLSDTVQGGDPRHYDPRFLVHRDRLYIHYNNNNQTRPNRIYLVELDPDTLEARAPARLLVLDGPRQEIEKNWMFFDHDGDLYAVYWIAPHTVLRVSLDGSGAVECSPAFATSWDVSAYADHYGLPCGGAPPVRRGDEYVSFLHSRIQVGALRRLLPLWPARLVEALPRYPAAILRRFGWLIDQRRYFGGVYGFAAEPPFEPRWIAPEPVLHPGAELPRRRRRRINPTAESVVYPCGAVLWDDGQWLISYGLHDERCCLRLIEHATLSSERVDSAVRIAPV